MSDRFTVCKSYSWFYIPLKKWIDLTKERTEEKNNNISTVESLNDE